MDIEKTDVLEGEVIPESSITRVESIPRGFSTKTHQGDVVAAGQNEIGDIWVKVQWDGENLDDRLYMLGRDVVILGNVHE